MNNDNDSTKYDDLNIDPSILENLTEGEKKDVIRTALIAKRAEERAEEKALERARKKREEERLKDKLLEIQDEQSKKQKRMALILGNDGGVDGGVHNSNSGGSSTGGKVVFISKRKRNSSNHVAAGTADDQKNTKNSDHGSKIAGRNNIENRSRVVGNNSFHNNNNNHNSNNNDNVSMKEGRLQQREKSYNRNNYQAKQQNLLSNWTEKDLKAVKESYLGNSSSSSSKNKKKNEEKNRGNKKATTHKITFRFKWDDTDDTFDTDDPLYDNASLTAISGNMKRKRFNNDHRSVRGDNNRSNRSNHANRQGFGDDQNSNSNTARYGDYRRSGNSNRGNDDDDFSMNDSVYTKPLHKMTTRDWRIFRENYEIVVRGGRAPPPLRAFRENEITVKNDPSSDEKVKMTSILPCLLDAIENVMRFKEPSPIQRQSIPIGLQLRDLIGIAETGSGKTVAFGVPLCNYILNLSSEIINSVADEGPLALVMAPTRELALQINDEFSKLLMKQSKISSFTVVGGLPIQEQAYRLRRGVHVVVGTPGRINECIELSYLVLNQCYYVVLDEADRMIDMGFTPQVESILDAMGGELKSENETETYKQESEDLKRQNTTNGLSLPKHRVTAMFSATMPLEVERMAKKYLRHPAVISIGDQDSSKNTRIEQRVIFLSSQSQKEKVLREILSKSGMNNRHPSYNRNTSPKDEKILIFVNEKKHVDSLGRIIERNMSYPVVTLHGGKSQDQRNESLSAFRNGGIIMVATDVAGRGLDIPDVTHVINYDLPTRSIENYTHRIGRTGRAGKSGLATSFITDADEVLMLPLKLHLETTGNIVPSRLANHPAAKSNAHRNLIH